MSIDRISSHGGDAIINRSQQAREAQRKDDPAAKAGGRSGDKVSLSQTARDLEAAKQAVDATPDVREDKIAAIRQRLEDGTYYVSNEALAQAMLRHASDEGQNS